MLIDPNVESDQSDRATDWINLKFLDKNNFLKYQNSIAFSPLKKYIVRPQ